MRKSFFPIRVRFALCVAILLAGASATTTRAAGGLVIPHAEDLRPHLTVGPQRGSATLEFTAFGRPFRLQLSDNQRLSRLAAGGNVQLYAGALDGVPHSWARIGVLDGLPRGVIWDGRELFVLDSAPEAVNFGAAGTVLFKLADAQLEPGASFADDAVENPENAAAAYDAVVGELRAHKQALEAGMATEGVEISVLGDAAYLARYRSEAAARDAILLRLNIVDGIFSSQVGVELRVASVNVGGESTATLSPSTEPRELLEDLSRLRSASSDLSGTGLTHLFTGRGLDGQTTGIAYLHALCSKRFGASLAMAHDSATIDALITAHEIGHVFGAPHDGTAKCASTPQDRYIMTPTFSDASITSFSQCSLDQIDAVLDSYSCVVALPPPAPDPTPTPEPPPSDNGSSGTGGSGGGGSLDASLLLLAALAVMRRRRRERSAH